MRGRASSDSAPYAPPHHVQDEDTSEPNAHKDDDREDYFAMKVGVEVQAEVGEGGGGKHNNRNRGDV